MPSKTANLLKLYLQNKQRHIYHRGHRAPEFLMQRKFDSVIALLDRNLSEFNNSGGLYYSVGLAYHYKEDKENASRFFKLAKKHGFKKEFRIKFK